MKLILNGLNPLYTSPVEEFHPIPSRRKWYLNRNRVSFSLAHWTHQCAWNPNPSPAKWAPAIACWLPLSFFMPFMITRSLLSIRNVTTIHIIPLIILAGMVLFCWASRHLLKWPGWYQFYVV